jgi:rhomboid protease GluP
MHCPRCGRLISVSSTACVHCRLPRPAWFTAVPILGDLIRGEGSFIGGITIMCFALYALALMLNLGGAMTFSGLFGILAPTGESLYQIGMGGRIPWQAGRWWTPLTATYLHGSLLHIAFNMLWLRNIGPLVEELYGASRFFILYTIAGLTGAAFSVLSGTPFFVGASGAIFGLFSALILYGRLRGGTFGTGLMRTMLIYAGIGFAFGLLMPGVVDNWGHLGGLVGGLITAWALGYEERSKQSLLHHLLAMLLIVFVAACFLMMVVTFFSG